MSELANYSIETDQTVLLAFRDGRRMRVAIAQLSHHLATPDLDKVKKAINLRQDFLRRHMPKAALVLAAGGLIAMLTVTGREVASLINPPRPEAPAPTQNTVVRSQTLPTPVVAPEQQPSVQGDSTVATSTSAHPVHRVYRRIKPALASHPSSIQPFPAVSVPLPSPILSPAPSPIADPPAADQQLAQLPVTKAHGQDKKGQVLGCSTSDATCTDMSGTTAMLP